VGGLVADVRESTMAKIVRSPSGKYRAVVDYGGQRRSATFATLKEARAGQSRMLIEMGSAPVTLTATIGDLLGDYLAASGGLSANHLYNARNVIGRLPDSVTELRADSVSALKIEAVYRSLLADGWGVHSVHRLHGILSASFKRATRYRLIGANAMTTVEAPTRPRTELHPPTAAEVRQLIAACTSDLHALTYSMAAATGARRGELVGLRWGDIDFTAGRISIVRSLAQTPGTAVHETPTKTGAKGQRIITVDADTMALIATRRAACPAGDWVLSPLGGAYPWRPAAISRIFRADMTAAGLGDGFRFHDLRHFHATQLLTAGVAPWIVARRLGHTNPATTMRVYSHFIPGTDAGAAEAIARVMRED
jgi:integrase